MNCTNCGAEIAPGSKFCVSCGTPAPAAAQPVYTPAPETAAPAPEANGSKLDVNAVKSQLSETVSPIAQKVKPFLSNKKVLMGIAAVVALLVIIGIISAIASSNNGFIKMKQSTMAMFNGEEISIIVDNKVLSETIDSEGEPETSSSLNGKVTAILTDEGELYVLNGKKLNKVDEDVINYQLSVTGKGLAYVVDGDEDYTLNLYTVSNKKNTTVSDELGSLNYAISPDGKSVTYIVEDDDESEVMYFKGSKSEKIATDVEAILGMSNNGKYIYIVSENDDGEEILYSYNKKAEREKLGDIDSEYVRFNDDHTQIMFYYEDKTYVSNKAKDAQKAASDSLRLVVAPNSQSMTNSYATTYPVDSLFDHVYYGDDAWLIKKNADKNIKLVSKVSGCSLDESAKYLYYIHDYEELQVLKISQGDKASQKAKTLAEDVSNYVVTSNRKKVYFISDETLYSVNGKKGGSPKKITNDDVESYYLAINSKDMVYYIMDGDAYVCRNGKKGTKVVSDAVGMTNTPTGVTYVATEDALYATKTSKKLKNILSID